MQVGLSGRGSNDKATARIVVNEEERLTNGNPSNSPAKQQLPQDAAAAAAAPTVSHDAWDASGRISDGQQASVDILAAACLERPLPSHVEGVQAQAAADGAAGGPGLTAPPAPRPATGSAAATLHSAVLGDAAQFYKWHGELMEQELLQRARRYQEYANLLESYYKVCAGILGQLDAVLHDFESLSGQQSEARRKVVTVLDSYRQLEAEEQALQKVADQLHAKLAGLLLAQRSGSGSFTLAGFDSPRGGGGGAGYGGSTAGAKFGGAAVQSPVAGQPRAVVPAASAAPTAAGGIQSWLDSTLGMDTSSYFKIW